MGDWLNYHHLFYFWNIAREGSVARASDALQLAQPTLKHQLRLFELSVGEKLFERAGRRLVLTAMGQSVFRYAGEIFALGREMQDVIKGRPTGKPHRLVVGIADAMPKLVAYRLLEPVLRMPDRPEIFCCEDRPGRLLADLANNVVDLVLSDTPLDSDSSPRVHDHLLGESAVSLLARQPLAAELRPSFPASLEGAPVLLPASHTVLRRAIEHWLDDLGLAPRIVGEFEDHALLVQFGEQGAGVVPASSVVEEQLRDRHGLEVVGRVEAIRQRFYALSIGRRLEHPAVTLITHTARNELFRA